jgi:hypothetical protein
VFNGVFIPLYTYIHSAMATLKINGLRSRCSYSLRAGRFGHRIPVDARFSAPVQTGPEAQSASRTIGTGRSRGVASTTHYHVAPRLKKE